MNQVSIGADNGLAPNRRQSIICTNSGILLIGPLGITFSEISIESNISFRKMHLKMSSAKWRQFCLGLNVFKYPPPDLNYFTVSLEHDRCSVFPFMWDIYHVFRPRSSALIKRKRAYDKRKISAHWDRENMAAILQTTFSNSFSGMKSGFILMKISWKFILNGPTKMSHHWFIY